MDKIKKYEKTLQIVEIEEFQCEGRVEALQTEQYWISQFKAWGFDITNYQGVERYTPPPPRKQMKSIQIPKEMYQQLWKHHKRDGVIIALFIRRAIQEKLEKQFPKKKVKIA